MADFPSEVETGARRMFDEALADRGICHRPTLVSGWWIRSHTPACGEGRSLDDLYAAYRADGVTFILGDPQDGAFVTVTPAEGASMGAMVREKIRVPLAEGERIAAKVAEQLSPLAKALVVVGSIRRRMLRVGDVEFVVLPNDLKAFDKAVKAMGFSGGDKMRKYVRMVEGVPVELYVAHKTEEMGSQVLARTGDYLNNVSMRAAAKRMGYKLDEYGIWKGKRPVLQSPDEREFYDFLGREWREPEQRSLARRSDLTDMARKLKSLGKELAAAERQTLDELIGELKANKYLEREREQLLETLYDRHFPDELIQSEEPAMAGFTMGAEELIEMGEIESRLQLGAEELIEMGLPAAAGETVSSRLLAGQLEVRTLFGDRTMVGIWDLAADRPLVQWWDADVERLFAEGAFADDSVQNDPSSLGPRFTESVARYADGIGVPARKS